VINAGQSITAKYTFSMSAVDFSEDPNVGFYINAASGFIVSINNNAFSWSSTNTRIQVDSIGNPDRLIILGFPVIGTLVFGNTPDDIGLSYGDYSVVGNFLDNSTDIPTSGFLGLEGVILVQYYDINSGGEFVDTKIFFKTTSASVY